MQSNISHGKTHQLVIGLLIIGAGIFFLLDHLDLLEAGEYLRYWPALLIVYGVSRLASPERKGIAAGSLFVLVGGLLLLQKLGVIGFSIWKLWPLLLVGIGFVLVRRAFAGSGRSESPSEGDSRINIFVMLGGVERKNSSKNFTGGEITAILGGCELDLRGAKMEGEEAVIDVFTFWGGIDIRVPEDWAVSVNSIPLMGGCEDKSRQEQKEGRNHLIVKGYVVMGGLAIG